MSENLKILIAGEGGQGVQTIAEIIAKAAFVGKLESLHIPNFGVEQRGGVSLAFLQISKSPIPYPKFLKADILAVLASRAVGRVEKYVDRQTKIINAIHLDTLLLERKIQTTSLNIAVLGNLAKFLSQFLSIEALEEQLHVKLADKPNYNENLNAFHLGQLLTEKDAPSHLGYYKRYLKPLVSQNNHIFFARFPYLCKGCGLCVERCPKNALSFSKVDLGVYGTPMPQVDLDKCIGCKICQITCPDCAIKVVKKQKIKKKLTLQ